jgi:putative endonuclease
MKKNKDDSRDKDCYKKELGGAGEDIAEDWLRARGFRIAQRNYVCRFGEIDLIAVRGRLLVFAEVKTRRSLVFGMPQEAVNDKKIRYIRRVASWYLTQNMRVKYLYDDFDIRFDVIEIRFASDAHEINHIENAF